MRSHRTAWLIAAAVMALAACTDRSDGNSADATTSSVTAAPSSTTTAPDYSGDPDSAFCALVESSDDRSVRDPFEPGLDPPEVQVRFRALQLRFEEYADVTPVELRADIDAVVATFDQLDGVLAGSGYDFDRLAETSTDLGAFDDPSFAAAADRISAYQSQVCT